MSEIIEFIITFVVAYLLSLAILLLFLSIEDRKLEKKISGSLRKIDESRAAPDETPDEGRAQWEEIDESEDEFDKSMDEISESEDEISESLDRMNESMDRTIEFKRIISEYLDNKIKRIEARENFCESQFWDEKNIH